MDIFNETAWGILCEQTTATPNKVLVRFVDTGEEVTYSQLKQQAESIAGSLVTRGVKKGDKVGIMLPNGSAYPTAWFACLAAGLVDVPINPDYRYTLLDHAVQRARISVVFTDEKGIAALDTVAPKTLEQLKFVVVADSVYEVLSPGTKQRLSGCLTSMSMLLGDATRDPNALPELDPISVASMRFTSGSTGLPKLVMMNNGHLVASARKFCDLMNYGTDHILYTCFPFHHVLASVTGILSTVCAGGTLVVAPKFSVHRYWDHIRDYEVTHAQILDPLIPLLMKRPETSLDRQHRLTQMYTAAGSYEDFEQRFGVNIVPLYDMTELTVALCYGDGEPRRTGSCGRESGLFEVKILDEYDREQPIGTDGEICVRPRLPNIMFLGYYGDEEQTVLRWRNLWFHTGDRGRQDSDGYYYFLGRMGDRIRRRGVNVSAEEIELVALEHPGVRECAAIAVPSDVTEDDIKLCVVLREGANATEADLANFMADRLPKSHRPRFVEVFGSLPKTDTEKIRRATLRTQGSEGLTSSTWDAHMGDYIRIKVSN